jgi:monoamine oxidase
MRNVVVVGAGIGGLYVAYQLLKTTDYNVIVLEKEDYIGGRVFTFTDSFMKVESGAGRFSKDHILFIQLLKELQLYSLLVQNSSIAGHYHIQSSGVCFIKQPNVDVIKERIISCSKRVSKSYLQNISFIQFAKSVLSPEDTQFLLDSFGYYSELVLMNAYDCIHLIGELDSKNKYYSLRGGLSLVIRELTKRIRNYGGKIWTNKEVRRIEEIHDGFSLYCNDGEYTCHTLVCALTHTAIRHIPFFRPILHMIRGIVSAPLCRIYAKYPIHRKHGPWFKGLKKCTVNNELRMVIPISEETGIIMISYSDNKFADFWQNIYKKYGVNGIQREIQKKIKEVLGLDIPLAKEIRLFYWPEGVGYWTPYKESSEKITKEIIQPFRGKNVFICGENFSSKYQQWMEGALETGSRAIQLIQKI